MMKVQPPCDHCWIYAWRYGVYGLECIHCHYFQPYGGDSDE